MTRKNGAPPGDVGNAEAREVAMTGNEMTRKDAAAPTIDLGRPRRGGWSSR